MDEMNIEMTIGHAVIRSYKRLSYQAWYALAEFIDNSTQCYFDNQDQLSKPLEISVTYDKDTIRIFDNALGMSLEELKRALSIGVPPQNTKGRSEYGLGLKTAACWFGDKWKVVTKKKGSEIEYSVEVDVENIAIGNISLPISTLSKSSELHYTVIEISKLHRKLHPRTIGRIKQHIRSLYRVDLRNADLWITVNDDEPINSEDGFTFLEARNGEPYKRNFETVINGKSITGWIGILGKGSRSNAGIAIIRRGRVIKGQPNAWRPYEIFGEARNDLINQRLIGEINLDAFTISHTKDEILWESDEEKEIEDYLSESFSDYISVARSARKSEKDLNEGPNDDEIRLASAAFKEEIESDDFIDALSIETIPPESVIKDSNTPLIENSKSSDPIMDLRIGDVLCKVYIDDKSSMNDPYFASDFPNENCLLVIINKNHPHFRRVKGTDGVINYLRECVYDALAEFKARKRSQVTHDTIKFLKDGLLRIEAQSSVED